MSDQGQEARCSLASGHTRPSKADKRMSFEALNAVQAHQLSEDMTAVIRLSDFELD